MPEVQKNPYLNPASRSAAGPEGAQVAPVRVAQVGAVYPDYYHAANMSSTASYSGARPCDRNITGFSQTLNICIGSYRYGFNGMEKDDEVKGSGNSYDFGARIYDPRVGRWLAVDAYGNKTPWFSPFSFASNTPVLAIDMNGDSTLYFNNQNKLIYVSTDKLSNAVIIIDDNSIFVFKELMKAIESDGLNNKDYINAHFRIGIWGNTYIIDNYEKWYHDVKEDEWQTGCTGDKVRFEKAAWLQNSNNSMEILDESTQVGSESSSIPNADYGSVGETIHSHYLQSFVKEGPSYFDRSTYSTLGTAIGQDTRRYVMVEGKGGSKEGAKSEINAIYLYYKLDHEGWQHFKESDEHGFDIKIDSNSFKEAANSSNEINKEIQK